MFALVKKLIIYFTNNMIETYIVSITKPVFENALTISTLKLPIVAKATGAVLLLSSLRTVTRETNKDNLKNVL